MVASGLVSEPTKRNALKVGAVIAAWFYAFRLELGGDVFGRKLLAACSDAAPFERIGRKILDMRADLFARNFAGKVCGVWAAAESASAAMTSEALQSIILSLSASVPVKLDFVRKKR